MSGCRMRSHHQLVDVLSGLGSRAGVANLDRASECLMSLPSGWVTNPSLGLTDAQQLTALGIGVVPSQAACALNDLLGGRR